jgi:hypothetical protein
MQLNACKYVGDCFEEILRHGRMPLASYGNAVSKRHHPKALSDNNATAHSEIILKKLTV